jgi:manganese transport protein
MRAEPALRTWTPEDGVLPEGARAAEAAKVAETPEAAEAAEARRGAVSPEGTAAVRADESPAPGQRPLPGGRLRVMTSMLGPAFVAAVAYVDPGNFATNLQGGARFGYELLWVVLVANLMAMLVQYLSAKLGIATGRNLPELCRERFPRWASWGLWIQAEVMAMATDVAECLGAAIGLNLLFGVPLLVAGLITGVIAFAILELQRRGYRAFELAIAALLAIVFAGFLYETLKIGPSAHMALRGLVPHLTNSNAVYLAVGIVGATVMPHVIYLHSALLTARVPMRTDGERRRVLRFERLDIIIALGLAGLINLAMVAVFAKLFHTPLLSGISSIQGAHAQIAHLVGGGAALALAVALLASGASSSSVGTFAGQVVMAGFIGVRIPMFVRRIVTMIPALVVLGLHVSATDALVLSQVVLAFGIPFALVPLVVMTGRRDVMGAQVNSRLTSAAAYGVAGLISAVNVFALGQQLLG